MHFTDVVTRRPHCCGQIATTFGKTDGTEPGYNLQITSRPTSLVSNNQLPMLTHEQGWHETINDIYINDIYHDSIIFSCENVIFSKKNLYYYYLLTFLIHAYLTQTAQVRKLLDNAKILPKISSLWVGRNNVTDDRHGRLIT